jgi:hypothetical protein
MGTSFEWLCYTGSLENWGLWRYEQEDTREGLDEHLRGDNFPGFHDTTQLEASLTDDLQMNWTQHPMKNRQFPSS